MKKILLGAISLGAFLHAPAYAQNSGLGDTAQVDFLGDSLSADDDNGATPLTCGGNWTWATQISSSIQTWNKRCYAVGGSGMSQLATQVTAAIAGKPASGKWVVSVNIGANDVTTGTPQEYVDSLLVQTTRLRNAGAKVVVSTITINKSGDASFDTAHNADRKIVNQFIRRYAYYLFDEVHDPAANDILGPDDTLTVNPSYWADEVHNSYAGHTLRASIGKQAIQSAVANNVPGWTVGPRPVVYTIGGAMGTQLDTHPEVSTSTQGGDPTSLHFEPKDINDKFAGYNRLEHVYGDVGRVDGGEGKFRTTCYDSGHADKDSIMAKGQPKGPHPHTFIGNTDQGNYLEYANYFTLRTQPNSKCGGRYLNSSLYWRPDIQKKLPNGMIVALRSDAISFYYTISYAEAPTQYRLLNGLEFIGGKDREDMDNTAAVAEIPLTGGWDRNKDIKEGWIGWQCVNGSGATINTIYGDTKYRAFKTPEGNDPWGGQCKAGYTLGALVNGPACHDGVNLRSPNGRGHVRYAIRQLNGSMERKCPDGWYKMPELEGKEWFSLATDAEYMDWCLSSDMCWDPDVSKRRTPGSTFHFDYIFAWDNWAAHRWQKWCAGVPINGDPGQPNTCNFSTISPTEIMGELPADPVHWNLPPAQRFWPIEAGQKGNATVHNNH